MRNIIIHTYCLAVILLFNSCGNDYDLTENFDLEELPGYVAFSSPGQTVTIDDIFVREGDGIVYLNIENPTGTLSDIMIAFEFGGNAEFEVDFSVPNANSSGGTIVLAHTPNSRFPDNAAIAVEILVDSIADGDKNLSVTLINASNDEGNLAVGRGGTDLLKSANINIMDID